MDDDRPPDVLSLEDFRARKQAREQQLQAEGGRRHLGFDLSAQAHTQFLKIMEMAGTDSDGGIFEMGMRLLGWAMKNQLGGGRLYYTEGKPASSLGDLVEITFELPQTKTPHQD